MRTIFFLAILSFLTPLSARDILQEICKANGLFKLYEAKELQFTFNVDKGDQQISRNWKWDILNNKIYLNENEVGKTGAFVNDMFWLVFPLEAYACKDQIVVTESTNMISPIDGKPLTEVAVQFTSGLGKSPNDTYKLYVDDQLIVREWAYFKASKGNGGAIVRWEAYQDFGGIKISTERNSTGKFKLWFSNISITQ